MNGTGVPADVLRRVAVAGADDAGGLPIELLGDFLDVISSAVCDGKPLQRRQLHRFRSRGEDAAEQGVALRALLDLYLSSAWRLWRELPAVIAAQSDPNAVVAAGEVMLRAVDDAVAELTEGFQLAQRSLVRSQVSARREFVDDLLTGGADVVGLLARASSFGLHLSGPHSVAVVTAAREFTDDNPLVGAVERAVLGSKGDADALVASKSGKLVIVFAAPDRDAIDHVLRGIRLALESGADGAGRVQLQRRAMDVAWQIAVGRPRTTAAGVVASYREALDALDLAQRLSLESPVIDARDLLVYRVLVNDRPAVTDLIQTLLTPLLEARGGAEPMVETLLAYFAAGGNTAKTARDLHLSVRAVTYRLDRIRELTGQNVNDPGDAFALHAAVLGAKLLDWPRTPLT
ncbi:CdaR family transcriptional regulator [Rhodococcus sp. ACPA4]|uniref:CdaR family transcriptional regulator n=1 Tax=Nocardia globerula TaxID=1818 RepID=A0A652YR72_NOCGL|nr:MULTISPECIES: helix-turn-helix domain-containing protein [Rhodococcus]NMD63344.1 PucR family transcriptional regulator [Nocardia globerula]NRI68436.1 PucR family transcriptional regulator [Rhodococcus sp. MS16]MCE4268964.1 helix-turn-helix domain-containing protein [Rhodococcus globerulus]PBC43390.1 CdaR family transcriptional regulator [Rhodococcus sp. ACPA4]PVX62908.1 CdaR family transcriptional regulator [Rhodococcus globerulus]